MNWLPRWLRRLIFGPPSFGKGQAPVIENFRVWAKRRPF